MKTINYVIFIRRGEQSKLIFLIIYLFVFSFFSFLQAQVNYTICTTNYIRNSTFAIDANNSTSVTDWTFNPAGDATLGWKKNYLSIYGDYLFIDRIGSYMATPILSATPCPNSPKIVKFYYNAGNVGAFTFNVKLGSNIIATFSENGIMSQSKITIGSGVTSSIVDRRFTQEGPISDNIIWNNVWHEVTLYVPNYVNGALSFEYNRTGGISRQIRLDNVYLYDAVPRPILNTTSGTLASCDAATFDLTAAAPYTPLAGYTYEWHTVSNNPSAATKAVDVNTSTTALDVRLGTYYLYMFNTCGSNCYSPASVAFTVSKPAGCCGTNLVGNGGFDVFTPNTADTFLSSIDKWTFNQYQFDQISIGSYLNGNTVLQMDPTTYTKASLTQVIKACPGDVLGYSMTFGMKNNALLDQNRTVEVSLGGIRLFDLVYRHDIAGDRIAIMKINSTITNFKVDGNPYTPPTGGCNGDNGYCATNFSGGTVLDRSILHSVTFDFPFPVTASANPMLEFAVNEGAWPYLDNISIINKGPIPQNPTTTTGSIICPGTTFDLRTVTPTATAANYKYAWHTTSTIGSPLVADPSKVGPGTYYLETISTCSGCPAASYTSFTVNASTCPTISGKVFVDYNGPGLNGISTPTNIGASGGLYAILTDASGKVISSTKINNDGTYTITGISGATGGTRVIINNTTVSNGGTLNTSTLNPNYFWTGEALGGTTPTGDINGISPSFSAGSSQTNVNFGIQSPPIAADASGLVCITSKSYNYRLPDLYGVDDDPNFNNGIGKKVIIKTLNQTNGTLAYDGVPISISSLPFTIAAYEPAKLIFTTGVDINQSIINFTYVFEDIAGTQSSVDGVIDYKLNLVPTVNDYTITIVSGGTFSYTPVNAVNGVIPSGTTYTWSAPTTPAVITGYNSGSNLSSITGTLTNTATSSQIVTYTVTANNSICSSTFKITVKVWGKTNYWMGGNGVTDTAKQNWADLDNWTAKYIPETGQDIEFATVNNYGTAAVNNLHLDTDRIIGSLINASDKNLVVTTGKQLTVEGTVQDGNTTAGTLIVQSAPDQSTGTLLFANPANNSNVQSTVEFYNKGYNCNCGFYPQKWQYFGIPVLSASAFPNPTTGLTVNRWDEFINGNKWVGNLATSALNAFEGYEITSTSTTVPTTIYPFTGQLITGNRTINFGTNTTPLTPRTLTYTSGVNYIGMNLIGNSYTAAIPITTAGLTFSGSINSTVYLFNTGTRDEWRKLNGSTPVTSATGGIQSGTYLAVPINNAGAAGLPDRIPSMHAFMVKVTGTTPSLTINYGALLKNDLVNGMAWRSGRDGVHTVSTSQNPYLVMDVIGSRSADRVWLFENPSTTGGFDNGWDGTKMLETGIAQLYVIGTDNSKLQVATVPDMVGTEFSFVADANENYTVNFAVTPDVETRRLYLRDLRSKQLIPIRNGVEVMVSGYKGDAGNRFRVVSEAAISNVLSSVEVFAHDRIISVVNHSDENCTAYVYDAGGRLSAQRAVKAKTTEYLNIPIQGVYVVKVIGKTVNEVKRVVN
ncbi:MAG: hypothetical protein Q4G63_00865 [Bacteroidia bacterium]|nr:hypothetical protein [Bacteroidia bacterium]